MKIVFKGTGGVTLGGCSCLCNCSCEEGLPHQRNMELDYTSGGQNYHVAVEV